MLEERGANITEAHALIHNGHLIQYSFPSACIRVTSCYALMLGIQEPSLNQTLQLEDVIVAVGSLTGCATESVGWRNRHSDLFAGVSSLVRPRSNAARCANISDLRTPHLRHSATRLARRPACATRYVPCSPPYNAHCRSARTCPMVACFDNCAFR